MPGLFKVEGNNISFLFLSELLFYSHLGEHKVSAIPDFLLYLTNHCSGKLLYATSQK